MVINMMDATTYKAIQRARASLVSGEKTFAVVSENKLLHCSDEHGVKPLLNLMKNDPALLEGAVVGDRIVGRTAALLCIYSKVKAVFAQSISDEGIELLDKQGILVTWQETIPYIVEKDLTSRYKLDLLLKDVDEPEKAMEMVKDYIAGHTPAEDLQ